MVYEKFENMKLVVLWSQVILHLFFDFLGKIEWYLIELEIHCYILYLLHYPILNLLSLEVVESLEMHMALHFNDLTLDLDVYLWGYGLWAL